MEDQLLSRLDRGEGVVEIIYSEASVTEVYAFIVFSPAMGISTCTLLWAAFLLCNIGFVTSQRDSVAGPPWVESQYSSSPPVYPSRKFVIICPPGSVSLI